MRRLFFWTRYLLGNAPWDTGITPPEITQLVEGDHLPAGRAIDLGCGTGTNAIYLAMNGWHVTAIDYIARPVRIARRKARQAGVAERIRFVVGDVSQLASMRLGEAFDLAVDIGCGHSLPQEKQPGYAQSLSQLLRPGGTLMLYMFLPIRGSSMGLEPDAVKTLFEPHFALSWSSLGEDTSSQARSAWYRFELRPEPTKA